jgi:hypothetical protein
LTDGRESVEHALEEAVSRALRDNLSPLQRTADDLRAAFAEAVAACSSEKTGNALSAILRAQAYAASLSASLSVLSNFAAIALKPPERHVAEEAVHQPSVATTVVDLHEPASASTASTVASSVPAPAVEPVHSVRRAHEELPLEPERPVYADAVHPVESHPGLHSAEPEMPPAAQEHFAPEPEIAAQAVAPEAVTAQPVFDLSSFPTEIQDLHRRANRVAKVAMQDIKLLRPNDVQLGRDHKDLCERLRSDLDKARKEYDRRFRAIQDHPVDYFHRWMVEILAEGHPEALGEYPYPSPVLRH